jgi:hypothetical protein
LLRAQHSALGGFRTVPTIPQLPPAGPVSAQDELPISQSGTTAAVTVAELFSGTQPAIVIPSGSLLGRVSLGPGGPEAVDIGVGLEIVGGSVAADGGDHAGFPEVTSLSLTDQAILNSSGTPSRLPLSLLLGLYSAGANISISGEGEISASTDPTVTNELNTLTQGLNATNQEVAALAAEIPTGGYVTLNNQGQMIDPVAGPVTLGTVQVAENSPSRTLGAMALDQVNVIDFGATPGAGDATAGFNAAFAALPSTGGQIFIPAGDYHLSSALTWANKSVTICGAGKGLTRLHIEHTGIGFDISQTSIFNKVIIRDFSAFAENTTGQTAAVAQLTFPSAASFGYVTSFITDVECFGYPNANNGQPPFPQTFLRGFVLNNCWSTQVNNVSFFGPPAAAGSTQSAVIELNGSIDTRISGVQAYYGNSIVLQTGYCEGIYFDNPLVIGTDFLFSQTNITTWPGYKPGKLMLLGLWAANGEVNIALGAVQAAAVGGGYFSGLDFSRDGGPNTSQTFFALTDCSLFYVVGCNFNGGPSGGNNQDVAFSFQSTFDSNNNTIGGCSFANMATVIQISAANGTVGLTTFALNPGNVPLSTAFIDNSSINVGNLVTFQSPATSTTPSGIACTKDHVFTAQDGSVLLRLNAVAAAANFLRAVAATKSNPPTLLFDGSDGTVNGVIQTKGGDLFFSAAGDNSGSGNLLSLFNLPGSVNWLQVQNATSGNLVEISTNAGGIGIQPSGQLWLSPSSGLFVPNLPKTKPPTGSNQIWNNNGVLNIA